MLHVLSQKKLAWEESGYASVCYSMRCKQPLSNNLFYFFYKLFRTWASLRQLVIFYVCIQFAQKQPGINCVQSVSHFVIAKGISFFSKWIPCKSPLSWSCLLKNSSLQACKSGLAIQTWWLRISSATQCRSFGMRPNSPSSFATTVTHTAQALWLYHTTPFTMLSVLMIEPYKKSLSSDILPSSSSSWTF